MSVSGGRYLWALAGCPAHPQARAVDSDIVCLVCGCDTEGQGVRAKDALGINFDHTQARRPDSEHVCGGCAWALAGKPPATLRMWSVAATTERDLPPSHPKCAMPVGPGAHLTNRADMRTVASLLCDPPPGEWLVTVAVSAQKHVVPYAMTSQGRGSWRVRVETCDITSDPTEMGWLLGRVARLRDAGFGPTQIAAVDPGTHLSTLARLTAWRDHAEPLAPYRGSPLLGMASIIPTKEHLHDYLGCYADRPAPAV